VRRDFNQALSHRVTNKTLPDIVHVQIRVLGKYGLVEALVVDLVNGQQVGRININWYVLDVLLPVTILFFDAEITLDSKAVEASLERCGEIVERLDAKGFDLLIAHLLRAGGLADVKHDTCSTIINGHAVLANSDSLDWVVELDFEVNFANFDF
jgi:hypothetical protein